MVYIKKKTIYLTIFTNNIFVLLTMVPRNILIQCEGEGCVAARFLRKGQWFIVISYY